MITRLIMKNLLFPSIASSIIACSPPVNTNQNFRRQISSLEPMLLLLASQVFPFSIYFSRIMWLAPLCQKMRILSSKIQQLRHVIKTKPVKRISVHLKKITQMLSYFLIMMTLVLVIYFPKSTGFKIMK